MNVAVANANASKFSVATVVDINIGTEYWANSNGTHKISLHGVWNNPAFVGEESRSNYMLVDKVRYTYDSAGNGHIDIHYIGTSRNPVWCTFAVHMPYIYQHWFVAENLTSVVDSPSGETVLLQYPFKANSEQPTRLPVTRIENSYFDATVVRRCYYQYSGDWLRFYLNLVPSTAMPPSSGFIDIAKIPLPSNYTVDYILQTVPAQNGVGVLLVQVANNGTVSVYNGTSSTIDAFCRAMIMTRLIPSI